MNRKEWLKLLAGIAGALITGLLARYGIYIPPHTPGDPSPIPAPIQPPAPQPPAPQQPAPQPTPTPNPPAALGRITFGNAGCTATVIGPRRADGRWDILTAAHCVRGQGQRGTMRMKDGRSFGVTVVAVNTDADACWLVSDQAITDLPFAVLSSTAPDPGTKVWHAGYGIDKPGNREEGEVMALPNREGQIMFMLSVSSGDSGGGIFREDTGELVSTVCCTERLSGKGRMYGAGPDAIRALRKSSADDAEWTPIPMPTRPPTVPDRLPDTMARSQHLAF